MISWIEERFFRLTGTVTRTMTTLLLSIAVLMLLFLASHRHRGAEAAYLTEQQALLAWVNTQRPAVERLRAVQRPPTPVATPTGESLVATVSGLAHDYELAVQHSETEADGGVSIALTDARFEHTMTWLVELVTARGVYIERLELDRGSQPGLVNVQMRIRR